MRIQAERDHEQSFLLKGSVHQRRKSAKIMLFSTLVSGDRGCTRPVWRVVQIRFQGHFGQTSKWATSRHTPRYTDIHLLPRAGRRPSQMIEFGFAASPETIRREPQGQSPSLSRPPAGPGSLRAV